MNLFTQLADSRAREMLDSINEGLKKKERFKAHFAFNEGRYIVYVAANQYKQCIYNVLMDDGSLPNNMSLCWRSWGHIQKDLKLIMI